MVTHAETTRTLVPGSSGWTCADLDRPPFDHAWEGGHYELIHGVIAQMPPMQFTHGQPLSVLAQLLRNYFDQRQIKASVGIGEVDLQVSSNTRYRVDGLVLMPDDMIRQERVQAQLRPGTHPFGVIVVPPTVVIESISLGHEANDQIEKFRDYAAFGVPNYWIVNAYEKTFRGWRLIDGRYEPEFNAKGDDATVKPAVYPGLEMPLNKVFM